MKFLNYFDDFHFFPLIFKTIELNTTKADIYKKVTEYPFDLIRSMNVAGDEYKHEYQSEINGDRFKLRKIQKSGYKTKEVFSGSIIYFKIIKEEEKKTVVRYLITFNLFNNLLLILFLLCFVYGIWTLINSHFSDFNLIIISLIGYFISLTLYDSEIIQDVNFITRLTDYFNEIP